MKNCLLLLAVLFLENTKWIINTKPYLNENTPKIKVEPLILEILKNRNIKTEYELDKFLYPDISKLDTPFNLSDVEKACERIINAINNKEKICIYGDYDVDGITSVSLFVLAFRMLDVEAEYYIPLRDEGYGLNNTAIQHIADNKTNLVITVDCGISSIEEVKFANSLGLDMIITDHHEINGDLPSAFAIINPKREDNKYKFKSLAGVGTAFMLLYALFHKYNKEKLLLDIIEIVGIGTIADIVPIIDDNRIFVKYGLENLKNTKILGLNILLKKIYKEWEKFNPDTYMVGFQIAPLFNAAGRLEDAKKAVELFITQDKNRASEIAEELIIQNNERKKIQENILKKVEQQIVEKNLDKQHVIISYDYDFHHGVIGIVASKIVDKYYHPAIIMELKDDNTAVASCRSIEGFNIIEALNSMKDLFIKYGGHEGAAGFSISQDNISIFIEKINSYADNIMNEDNYIKPVKIETELIIEKVSFDFYDSLYMLFPFGFANPNPIFCIKNMLITGKRCVGSDKTHLMIDVKKDNKEIRNCIWFSKGYNLDKITLNKEYDIAFKMKCEEYKGKFYTKLYIEDIKKSEKNINKNIELYFLKNTVFPLNSIAYTRKQVNVNDSFDIKLNEDYSGELFSAKSSNAFLSSETAFLLKKLSDYYNYQFNAVVNKIIETDENYQLFITIDKIKTINIFSNQDSKIFSEIKKFLINDFDYNSLQKKILSELFHKNKNVLVISEKNRGVFTSALTIAMYHFIKTNKKSLFISDNNNLDSIYKQYFDFYTENQNIENYPFYFFYNTKPFNNSKNSVLVFSETDMNLDKFIKLEDNLKVSSNINIINNDEFYNYPSNEDINFYSKNIPNQDKLNIINKIKENKKIIATKDINILF